jgi:hypothetical protein
MPDGMNELTFVARLGTATRLRAERLIAASIPPLIYSGELEERQVDTEGRVRRCDIRLNSRSGTKLVSGEVKRPEVPEGRDPRNDELREDARRKAIARGLPFYFTCNMAEVVLYSLGLRASESDREEHAQVLAPIRHSSEVDAYRTEIEANWSQFLDDLEARLSVVSASRPSVTTADVVALRDAIYAVADEALARVVVRVESDPTYADRIRVEAENSFNFSPALESSFRSDFQAELSQLLRFGVFVAVQKLVLYRVLEEAGPRRSIPFRLDRLEVPKTSSDPGSIQAILRAALSQAIDRSEDFETAFLPEPLSDLVFTRPRGSQEIADCRVGPVWNNLLEKVESASWASISRNLIGLLYELLVEPAFRHRLGQFYTREDVVDILVTFAVRQPGDRVLDPAAGGGSFLRSVYDRERALGNTHDGALASIWGCEITAFAAELSTVTLATSDPTEAAAYPRVLLTDFFDIRPGISTELEIPGFPGKLRVPESFDAVVGNPPYISYRRQTNQQTVIRALASSPDNIVLPRFSGKSDAYVWFIVHATQFLKEGGRLSFVVSSALLFSDYGVSLIRFLGAHYKVCAVIDSLVERWFPDADTNTILLLLERCSEVSARATNEIRFIRLRRPLAQLFSGPNEGSRRDEIEQLVTEILCAAHGGEDPRFAVNVVSQGEHAGLEFISDSKTLDEDIDE